MVGSVRTHRLDGGRHQTSADDRFVALCVFSGGEDGLDAGVDQGFLVVVDPMGVGFIPGIPSGG